MLEVELVLIREQHSKLGCGPRKLHTSSRTVIYSVEFLPPPGLQGRLTDVCQPGGAVPWETIGGPSGEEGQQWSGTLEQRLWSERMARVTSSDAQSSELPRLHRGTSHLLRMEAQTQDLSIKGPASPKFVQPKPFQSLLPQGD